MESPGRLQNILAATDFSRGADVAIEWATAIAASHGATLTLFHGVVPPPRTSIALDLQSMVDERLAEVAERVRGQGVKVQASFEFGRPWEVIVRAEAEKRADLIVLGSRGHTPATHLSLGRVADRVIRTAVGPVLTVHPNDLTPTIRINTVLTAVDFSAESAIAAETAAVLLLGFAPPRRLILLHACHAPVRYAVGEMAGLVVGDITEIEPIEAIAPRLEEMARQLCADDLTVETMTSEGYARSAIEAVAADRNVDLIAMGTSGRSRLSRLLLGSNAERTLHHATRPVLTVRHPTVSRTPSKTEVESASAR